MFNIFFYILYQLFYVIYKILKWFLSGIFYRIPILKRTFFYERTNDIVTIWLPYRGIKSTIPEQFYTFKRYINVLKVDISLYLSLALKKPIVWGYPLCVAIEPTNLCNLRCPLCTTGSGRLLRDKGFMTFDIFKKIIDDIHPHFYTIRLYYGGEPFLHKDICKMISYAKSKNMFITIDTNANIDLPADELVKFGLDRIQISMDAASQDTYNKYRINGSFDYVLDNVRKLIRAKQKFNKTKPDIVCKFLIFKHNEHEMDDFRLLCERFSDVFCNIEPGSIFQLEDDYSILSENPNYRWFRDINDNKLTHEILNRCDRIWKDVNILQDGEMCVCCHDREGVIKIGNIKDNSFKSLWKSIQFNIFRHNIYKNRKQFDICRACPESVVFLNDN